MSLVLDSSIALAWCFEDERVPAAVTVLERVVDSGAIAPASWPLEVLNALAMTQRRQRLGAAQRLELTDLLRELPIKLDTETPTQAWGATARLAELHQLTVYDAAYLELAQRLRLPLGTLDRALASAALASGVAVLGVDS
ncbi:MAG: type II toxin-antitoxin system VapC family toxin [Burkholderiaceae bacterium]|nr:type II toxin-antitoxin system VapC family toxin [Burkholderiaceae bacterium]